MNYSPPDKFQDDQKNLYSDAAGWCAVLFECPVCLHRCAYVFPGDVYWLDCPKCGEVSHTDECVLEWGTGDNNDDEDWSRRINALRAPDYE